jgi:hypothetical protein
MKMINSKRGATVRPAITSGKWRESILRRVALRLLCLYSSRPMKLLIPLVVAVLALGVSAYGDDAADARKAAAAERKAETVRKAEVKSLKQEVQALQSQKTSGAKEYGDKVRAINAKKDVIRAKEQQ